MYNIITTYMVYASEMMDRNTFKQGRLVLFINCVFTFLHMSNFLSYFMIFNYNLRGK
jgi:hypothetical protein